MKFELRTFQVVQKLAVSTPCSVANSAAKELSRPVILYCLSIV
jgi:hypothetical protein